MFSFASLHKFVVKGMVNERSTIYRLHYNLFAAGIITYRQFSTTYINFTTIYKLFKITREISQHKNCEEVQSEASFHLLFELLPSSLPNTILPPNQVGP